MTILAERITLNPYTESGENEPLELSAWRGGQGVFLDGATYEPAPEDVHLAKSVDTEGATAFGRTVPERPSPVIKVRVIEPTDPEATNYVYNPQVAEPPNSSGGVTFGTGAVTVVQEEVHDLNGFDFAAFIATNGVASAQGAIWGGPGLNEEGPVGTTDGFPLPKFNVPYTVGAWMKGAVGGEMINLAAIELFNLVQNPSFEHDTLGGEPFGWTHASTGTFTFEEFKVRAEHASSGLNSLHAKGTAGAGSTFVAETFTAPCTPFTAFSAQVTVSNNVGELANLKVQLGIQFLRGGKVEATVSGTKTTLKGTGAPAQVLTLENVVPTFRFYNEVRLILTYFNEEAASHTMDMNIDGALLCHGALPKSKTITNLVPNPNFEYDTAGGAPAFWVGVYSNAATREVVAAGAFQGKQCQKIVTTATLVNEGVGISNEKPFKPVIGQSYVGAMYLKGNVGGEKIQLIIGTGVGAVASKIITLTNTWERYELAFTPTTSEQVNNEHLFFAVRTPGTETATWFIDDVLLIEGTTAPGYVDGDSNGYAWFGTPGQSVTVLTTFFDGDSLEPSAVLNYVSNPSFEYDTIGNAPAVWSNTLPGWFLNTGATLTVRGTSFGGNQVGAQHLEIVTTNASAFEGAIFNMGRLNAGSYTFSVYLKGNAGGEKIQLCAGQGNATGKIVGKVLTNGYARYTITFTTDGTAVCYCGVRTETAAVVTMFMDAVQVIAGAPEVAPEYADGDQPGGQWSGVQGQSESLIDGSAAYEWIEAAGKSISWKGAKVQETLTTTWHWYTVTRPWRTGPRGSVIVYNPNATTQSWFTTGVALVQLPELAEYFDGTWPGCHWEGVPNISPSFRPGPGGPRRDAIMADIERSVTAISRNHSGTLRRTLVGGHQITFDLLNAQLVWDEQQFTAGGVAAGTIRFTSQPYGRSPEFAPHIDELTFGRPQDFFMQKGLFSDFVFTNHLQVGTNRGEEHLAVYKASRYPYYAAEVETQWEVGSVVSGTKYGCVLAWQNETNYIEGYLTDNGTHSILKIDAVIEGVRQTIQEKNLAARVTTGQKFTLRFLSQNNALLLLYFPSWQLENEWTENPTASAYAEEAGVLNWNVFMPTLCGWSLNANGSATFTMRRFKVSPYVFQGREELGAVEAFITGVPGTAPALGRIVVTEESNNDQWWWTWGQQLVEVPQESLYKSLWLGGHSLLQAAILGGFPNAEISKLAENNFSPPTGESGAKQRFNYVREVKITEKPVAIGGGELPPGTYQIFIRAYEPSTNHAKATVSLNWGTRNSGIQTSNEPVQVPGQNDYYLLNLGQVTIPENTTGWGGGAKEGGGTFGAITGIGGQLVILVSGTYTAAGPNTLAGHDVIYFDGAGIAIPVTEGGGKAEGALTLSPDVSPYVFEDFHQDTDKALLNGLAPSINGINVIPGGKWETSGSTGDFEVNIASGEGKLVRTGGSDTSKYRFGRMVSTAVEKLSIVQCDIGKVPSRLGISTGVMFDWTSEENWIGFVYNSTSEQWEIIQRTVGKEKILASQKSGVQGVASPMTELCTVRAVIDPGKRAYLWAWPTLSGYQGQSVVCKGLVTVERSGVPGILDYSNSTSNVRTFKNWFVGRVAYDTAIPAAKTLQLSSNRVAQAPPINAAAEVHVVSKYEGDYLRVPVLTKARQASRIVMKMCRNDPTTQPDVGTHDEIRMQLNVTPRWANIPET